MYIPTNGIVLFCIAFMYLIALAYDDRKKNRQAEKKIKEYEEKWRLRKVEYATDECQIAVDIIEQISCN